MTLYEIEVTTLDGVMTTLAPYTGQVLLIVNVASACGFTPQYAGLEALYRRFRPEGFAVLGFPCNQFGQQEPGTPAAIAEFCNRVYDVTFPMFAKLEVNGRGTHPLYRYLKAASPGILQSRAIKWNFTKFLVARSGAAIERYAPTTKPEELEGGVQRLLAQA